MEVEKTFVWAGFDVGKASFSAALDTPPPKMVEQSSPRCRAAISSAPRKALSNSLWNFPRGGDLRRASGYLP